MKNPNLIFGATQQAATLSECCFGIADRTQWHAGLACGRLMTRAGRAACAIADLADGPSEQRRAGNAHDFAMAVPAGAATYEMPPESIAKLVDAPVTPSFTLDPTRSWALIVEQPALPPIEEIAREERKLGGIRFDPTMWTPSNLSFGLGISFRRILDGDTPVALGSDLDIEVTGLPKDAGVRWIKWRPSGGAVAFVVRPEKSSEQLELWYAEFDAARPGKGQRCVARPLIKTVHCIAS